MLDMPLFVVYLPINCKVSFIITFVNQSQIAVKIICTCILYVNQALCDGPQMTSA